jgi:hypothetical protein
VCCAAMVVSHCECARVIVPTRKLFALQSPLGIEGEEVDASSSVCAGEYCPTAYHVTTQVYQNVFEVGQSVHVHLAHGKKIRRMLTVNSHCVCTILASVAM